MSQGENFLRLSLSPWAVDERGTTLVTYALVLPLLILLIFGSFAVWRIMGIRQSLYLGTYQAARELCARGRGLGPNQDRWVQVAEPLVRDWVEKNRLVPSGYALNVDVTLPNSWACGAAVEDVLFTVQAQLTLPSPIHIPYLAPINMTLTERHTSYVECPRGWAPPREEHIY